ncbi:MAG: DUF1549 domain-containing protein [Verrucomicrobia bacterium]|nr:DUF1549 domain-containing protein [Verrucomicrobiota bacterium]
MAQDAYRRPERALQTLGRPRRRLRTPLGLQTARCTDRSEAARRRQESDRCLRRSQTCGKENLAVVRSFQGTRYHGDQNQRIFPYRDYIINAFNTNKPFDVFTREQLAGDLLPNPTEEQLVASGYNRLNMMTREGGAQAKEYLAKYGAERVRSVSNAWLGSTFGCAECHDHKFDPIKSADFYSLQAFFADVKQWGVYADYNYTPEPELKGVGNDYPFYPEVRIKNAYLSKKDAQAQSDLSVAYAKILSDLKANPQALADFADWQNETSQFLAAHPSGLISPAGTFFHKAASPTSAAAMKKLAKP